MKIIDLNREGGIGANALFLQIGPFRIVVDAGMHPKMTGKEALPDFSQLSDETIDLIILTHCHLDHLGGLPVLARSHPDTQIWTTTPARLLATRMLHHSVNVMALQRDALEKNDLPLYSHSEITRLERQIIPVSYEQNYIFERYNESIILTFYRAGHIPGSAGVEIVYKNQRIFITGDVLFTPQLILPGAHFPKGAFDTLIMETTRGSKEKSPDVTRASEVKRLVKKINQTLSHGGSCLIPVFALGRMQEILTIIDVARDEGTLKESNIYCAGLGLAIADVFDKIARKTSLVQFRRKILKKLNIKPLAHSFKPGQLPTEKGIFVISSGMMMENTPSYNVAASLLAYHQNSICFVGYCDKDTPGGKLINSSPYETFIFDSLDYSCPVAAHIEQFDLTGHAERDDLLTFALASEPRSVVLTHGDEDARNWFSDSFQEYDPKIKIINPKPLQLYEV